MGAGPYIVLPGLGPSNLRDTLSMLPDAFLTPLYVIDHDRTSYSLTAIDIVETRARYLGLESVVIGDDYLFYRDAYLQSREFDILDGEVSEEFDEFDDFD
jgi:phospholipid-binding lipoprotein MlaA